MSVTNNKQLPLSLAVFLATDNYDHNHDPNTISVTTLLKPTREILLAMDLQLTDVSYDISQTIQSALGSAIHEGIENSWLGNYESAMLLLGYPQRVIDRVLINPTKDELKEDSIPIYLEQRLVKKFGNFTITGKMDFIFDGSVEDFKNTSVYQVMHALIKDKTTKQLSLLRWLDPTIITEDYGSIQYIIKDWRGSEAYQEGYPPQAMLEHKVKLASYEATEQFVSTKIETIEKLRGKNQSLFPLCNDDDLWIRPPAKPFKYYKDPAKANGGKGRSTRNYAHLGEAQAHLAKDGSVGTIVTTRGEPKACNWCSVLGVCDQARDLITSGQLVLRKL